ncbi:MAG: sigma-70 family RNA polymerase sigma factor [Deltaproteobacteria bacterium]|nr:sigma-70 family RNA polymerase sigma factor [Deltaproteobacteria bacterium]
MSPEANTDVSDLRAIARGDRDALGRLYDRYAPRMLALGLAILRDRREAEDILHDVFVQVWERAGDYDPRRGRVKTWLYLRMRSRAIDRVRSPAYSKRRALPTSATWLTGTTTMEERGDHARLEAALSDLPTPQREVLVLGYFEGLSNSEIASRLSVPLGTVKSRTSAAMAKLRAHLGTELAL